MNGSNVFLDVIASERLASRLVGDAGVRGKVTERARFDQQGEASQIFEAETGRGAGADRLPGRRP